MLEAEDAWLGKIEEGGDASREQSDSHSAPSIAMALSSLAWGDYESMKNVKELDPRMDSESLRVG